MYLLFRIWCCEPFLVTSHLSGVVVSQFCLKQLSSQFFCLVFVLVLPCCVTLFLSAIIVFQLSMEIYFLSRCYLCISHMLDCQLSLLNLALSFLFALAQKMFHSLPVSLLCLHRSCCLSLVLSKFPLTLTLSIALFPCHFCCLNLVVSLLRCERFSLSHSLLLSSIVLSPFLCHSCCLNIEYVLPSSSVRHDITSDG